MEICSSHCVSHMRPITLRQDDVADAGRVCDNQWRCVTKFNLEPAQCRKCQAYHAKVRCMSPSATHSTRGVTQTKMRHLSQPSAIGATPAKQKQRPCHQVPRLPRKSNVRVTKCYAWHSRQPRLCVKSCLWQCCAWKSCVCARARLCERVGGQSCVWKNYVTMCHESMCKELSCVFHRSMRSICLVAFLKRIPLIVSSSGFSSAPGRLLLLFLLLHHLCNSYTQLCHTELFHTHNSVAHNSCTRSIVTHNFLTFWNKRNSMQTDVSKTAFGQKWMRTSKCLRQIPVGVRSKLAQ